MDPSLSISSNFHQACFYDVVHEGKLCEDLSPSPSWPLPRMAVLDDIPQCRQAEERMRRGRLHTTTATTLACVDGRESAVWWLLGILQFRPYQSIPLPKSRPHPRVVLNTAMTKAWPWSPVCSYQAHGTGTRTRAGCLFGRAWGHSACGMSTERFRGAYARAGLTVPTLTQLHSSPFVLPTPASHAQT